MSYGEEDGAIGYLVGEENRGIQCMFTMMNNARLTVGLQGVSVSERAYQQALSFCNERVQGIAPGFQEPGPIARHPDVQRMLANMKSITEASRALAYSACAEVDYSGSDLPAELLEKHKRKLGVLTPVVKGWCTETAQEVASVSLQCHGGMGYVEETGIAQILRDARILPIYEGTNGIQAMDLIGRKIISDDGLGVRELILEMQECVEAPSLTKLISTSQIDRFKKSLDDLEETVSIITKNSDDKEFTGKIAFDTLMMIGTISAAWQMLLSVERASVAFKNNTSSSEFLKEKTETAKHYLDFIMPRYLSNFSTISACTN
tara:strand:- start:252 stop:1208 length:957 start_codon:yes stop_codon:yes gene_type:complete